MSNDTVDLANRIVRQAGIDIAVQSVGECSPSMFCAVFECSTGTRIAGLHREPTKRRHHRRNLRALLDCLYRLGDQQIAAIASTISLNGVMRGQEADVQALLGVMHHVQQRHDPRATRRGSAHRALGPTATGTDPKEDELSEMLQEMDLDALSRISAAEGPARGWSDEFASAVVDLLDESQTGNRFARRGRRRARSESADSDTAVRPTSDGNDAVRLDNLGRAVAGSHENLDESSTDSDSFEELTTDEERDRGYRCDRSMRRETLHGHRPAGSGPGRAGRSARNCTQIRSYFGRYLSSAPPAVKRRHPWLESASGRRAASLRAKQQNADALHSALSWQDTIALATDDGVPQSGTKGAVDRQRGDEVLRRILRMFPDASKSTRRLLQKRIEEHRRLLQRQRERTRAHARRRQASIAAAGHFKRVQMAAEDLVDSERVQERRHYLQHRFAAQSRAFDDRVLAIETRQRNDELQRAEESRRLASRARDSRAVSQVFGEALRLDKERVLAEEQYRREAAAAAACEEDERQLALLNRYSDQVALLRERLERERKEGNLRRKAQKEELRQLRCDLRWRGRAALDELVRKLAHEAEARSVRGALSSRRAREELVSSVQHAIASGSSLGI